MSIYLNNFCVNSSNLIQNGWNRVRDTSSATAIWARNHLAAIWTNDLTPRWANKYIEMYIRPFDSVDAIILTAVGLLALGVAFVVMPILGAPFVAFGVIGIAALVLCGLGLVRHRCRTKLCEEAVVQVDEMIGLVNASTLQQCPVDQLEEIMVILRNEKYEHVEDKMKRLDKRLTEFREDYRKQDPVTFNNLKQAFERYLNGFRVELVPF